MLILRVASGRAWKSDTGTRTMRFERRSDPAVTTFTAAGLSIIDKHTPENVATLKDESGLKV